MERYVAMARREYGIGFRLAMLPAEAALFLIVMPRLMLRGGAVLDRRFRLPPLPGGGFFFVLGLALAVPGIFLASWSIQLQYTRGRGTPVPAVATQRLVTEGPFRYCRNPMTLGTMMLYSGVALWAGSLGAVIVVKALALAALAYIVGLEEKELEARFGEEYAAYKSRVPLLIPRLRRRSEDGRA